MFTHEIRFKVSYILKQTWCLSMWTKIGQCLEDSSNHCPFLYMTPQDDKFTIAGFFMHKIGWTVQDWLQ